MNHRGMYAPMQSQHFMKTPFSASGLPNQMVQQFGRNVPNQPYYCTFLPNSQMPGVYRSSDFRAHLEASTNQQIEDYKNIPTDSDIIYASYANSMKALNNETMTGTNNCKIGTMPCFSTNQCIPQEKWCDSRVDCLDSSDETACSCKSRLVATKICDGYQDCPMGSDEIGCFGCDKFSYSCFRDETEYRNSKQSTFSMCFTIPEKCDGYHNCLNGRDEMDCNLIAKNIGHHLSYTVSYTEGFLHRNYKGKWYPVCENPMKWAQEACQAEVGNLNRDPILTYKAGIIPGPFIHQSIIEMGEPVITETCPTIMNMIGKSVYLYVTCPPIQCGTVIETEVSKLETVFWLVINF